MISKERLEELIEKGATIWSNDWEEEIVLNKDHCVFFYCTRYINEYDCDILSVDEGDGYVNNYIIRELEEDVESAKWKLKFGNITRTEILSLPTFEEFIEKKFVWFNRKDYKQCCLHYLGVDQKIYINTSPVIIECGDLTKENYLKACEICRKLFLGEKVEEV